MTAASRCDWGGMNSMLLAVCFSRHSFGLRDPTCSALRTSSSSPGSIGWFNAWSASLHDTTSSFGPKLDRRRVSRTKCGAKSTSHSCRSSTALTESDMHCSPESVAHLPTAILFFPMGQFELEFANIGAEPAGI
eukprot:3071889-Amphidinium_carterae.1